VSQNRSCRPFLLAPAILLASAVLHAAPDSAVDSYRRARKIVDAGIQALGPDFEAISYQVEGKFYARDQSPSPEGPPAAVDFRGALLFDMRADRLVWEAQAVFPGGFDFHTSTRVKDGQAVNLDLVGRTSTPLPASAPLRETIGLRIPRYLLAKAVERSASLRFVGEADFRGRKQNVVSFATANGTLVTVSLDAETNLVTKYEQLGSDPIHGDAVTEVVLMGYETVEGRNVSRGHVQTVGGEPAQEWSYSGIRLNPKTADSDFAAPADFKAAVTLPQTPAVRELSKDVYQVEGLGAGAYRVLFVVLDDYVLVVEGVLNDAASRAVLDRIRETAPGKPVRYIGQTHHHSDHAGGLRTYFAEGVTLVTTPGNVRFFQALATAPFTVQPDAQSRKPLPPRIETIEGKRRVFTDGTHTVELIDIGPAPHADEMVIAWLPKEKLVFTGDLFGRYADDSVTPANASTQHFAAAIRRLGLPVETILDVHTRPSTMQDLETSLKLAAP
jgi:glyoxylase-like metal-dependent hydrolase (beta-lactamase superfamily II)